MSSLEFIILGTVFLIANIVEAVSGFGSIILAVTLGSNFFDIEFLLPIIVPLSVILNIYIVTRYSQYIDKKFLLKKVSLFMGIGLLLGIYIFNILEGNILKKIYGILIIVLSLKELYFYFNKKEPPTISKRTSNIFIFFSGLMQGIYASGGPLLAYGVSSMKFSKTAFRSNLSVVWLVSNITLVINYYNKGILNSSSLKYSMVIAPLIIVGIFIGEKVHKRIDEISFKKAVYIILLIAGLSLSIRS